MARAACSSSSGDRAHPAVAQPTGAAQRRRAGPPIQMGSRSPCGGFGSMAIASAWKRCASAARCARRASTPASRSIASSMRRPRPAKSSPSASYSASCQPTPTPRRSRPAESVSRVLTCLATRIGLALRQHQHLGRQRHPLGDGGDEAQRHQRLEDRHLRRVHRRRARSRWRSPSPRGRTWPGRRSRWLRSPAPARRPWPGLLGRPRSGTRRRSSRVHPGSGRSSGATCRTLGRWSTCARRRAGRCDRGDRLLGRGAQSTQGADGGGPRPGLRRPGPRRAEPHRHPLRHRQWDEGLHRPRGDVASPSTASCRCRPGPVAARCDLPLDRRRRDRRAPAGPPVGHRGLLRRERDGVHHRLRAAGARPPARLDRGLPAGARRPPVDRRRPTPGSRTATAATSSSPCWPSGPPACRSPISSATGCASPRPDRTGFLRSDELPGDAAVGYLAADGPADRTNVFHLPVLGSGDGGIYSTVADVHRLWQALDGGRIVAPERWRR